MKSHYINLISGGLALVAVILHIICIAESYYATVDVKELMKEMEDYTGEHSDTDSEIKLQMYMGLFRGCLEGTAEGQNIEFCFTYGDQNKYQVMVWSDIPDWLRASQALAIIGVLLVAGTTALLLLHVFNTSQGDRKRLLPPFILALCVAGAIFILIADVVFATELRAPQLDDLSNDAKEEVEKVLDLFKLSWGFWLDIVAGMLALLAGLSQGAAICLSRSEGSGIV